MSVTSLFDGELSNYLSRPKYTSAATQDGASSNNESRHLLSVIYPESGRVKCVSNGANLRKKKKSDTCQMQSATTPTTTYGQCVFNANRVGECTSKKTNNSKATIQRTISSICQGNIGAHGTTSTEPRQGIKHTRTT